MENSTAFKLVDKDGKNDPQLKDGDGGGSEDFIAGIQIGFMDNGFLIQTEYESGALDRTVYLEGVSGSEGLLGALIELTVKMGGSGKIQIKETE
jgi:hypothetical protein